MKTILLPALRLLLAMTALTGAVYPLILTAAAHALFPRGAGGSLVTRQNRTTGSSLLAQRCTGATWFHPRPSAADYATVASGASNLGPASATLRDLIASRRTALQQEHGLSSNAPVPEELLLASGSGLDPHLSPAAARFQVNRVAAARGLAPERILALLEAAIEPPQFGFLGQARVNVLHLNLAVEALK